MMGFGLNIELLQSVILTVLISWKCKCRVIILAASAEQKNRYLQKERKLKLRHDKGAPRQIIFTSDATKLWHQVKDQRSEATDK